MAEQRQTISLGREELLAFAKSNISFYNIELERLSSVLIAQLLQMYSGRVIDIANVTAEIKAMEEVGPKQKTEKEGAFKPGSPLEGFYKKHFTDASFILQNLDAELGYKNGGNKKLSQLIGRSFHEHKGQYVHEGFVKKIAHESTFGAIARRAGRNALTEEWIVFKKQKGKRFYLCLASHTEPNEQILSRAQDAIAMNFQFLVDGVQQMHARDAFSATPSAALQMRP